MHLGTKEMLSMSWGNFYFPTSWEGKWREVRGGKERGGGGKCEEMMQNKADLEVFFWPRENLSSLFWDPSLEKKKRQGRRGRGDRDTEFRFTVINDRKCEQGDGDDNVMDYSRRNSQKIKEGKI